MNKEDFARKLAEIGYYGISFTSHAELRLLQRQIDKKTIIGHLRNPESLKVVERLHSESSGEKYKLWFIPHRRIAYIYVVIINNSKQRIVVVTAIKQKLRWQKRVNRHAGKI